jgi:hypothetical protein
MAALPDLKLPEPGLSAPRTQRCHHLIPSIAPVTPHLILCFIAEKVLGLPKSY